MSFTRSITFVLCIALCASGGCASPAKNTTRLTNDDLTEISTQIADKLRASDFLADRGPASPPLTIAITKVVNYTSDIMPESERWYVMERVVDSLALRTLSTQKNLSFVLPKDRLDEMKAKPDADTPSGRRPPTHSMNAVFRSATYSTSDARTDSYYCQYEITDLADGRVVWSDRFEFKRAAIGRSYN